MVTLTNALQEKTETTLAHLKDLLASTKEVLPQSDQYALLESQYDTLLKNMDQAFESLRIKDKEAFQSNPSEYSLLYLRYFKPILSQF